MLQLDLTRSSEELTAEVAERCSTLGPVNKVTVYPGRPGSPARPFAIVSMGAREGAESVAGAFGGRTVGAAVIVFLEEPPARVFSPLAAAVLPGNVVVLGGQDCK